MWACEYFWIAVIVNFDTQRRFNDNNVGSVTQIFRMTRILTSFLQSIKILTELPNTFLF